MRLTVALPQTLRLAAATVLVAAAGTVLPAAPAAAATCSSDTGVSVVVDFGALGGGISTSCVPDGGGDSAGSLFEVHHDLTRAARFQGAVCRVDGAPADAACQNMPPAHAYWGLFWSDGSGGWVYSSEGVDSLNVPDGGSVAFAWQDGGAQDAPGVAPRKTNAEQSASPAPSSGGTGGGTGGGAAGSGGGSAGSAGGGATTAPSSPSSGSPSGTPDDAATTDRERRDRSGPSKRGPDEGDRKREPQKRDGKKDRGRDKEAVESQEPFDDASSTAEPVVTADPPVASGDGLPVWVAPAGIAVLFGIAGVVALLRRRSMA